jgi:LPXTG-site transpeptidase (sortase) family protein
MPEEEEDKHFTLHISAPETPVEKFHKKEPVEEVPVHKVSNKIWGALRFISSAAIIFIVLFFAMNWNAYSVIIMDKLGFLKPATDIIEEETKRLPADGEPQELLDLSKDPEVQKSQIPDLALNVTPPDTRVVIPRINKNVPVVTISTEALVNRDWARLEQEIQEALHGGVVHYPGTAFPDEEGNVVITGHSSYFAWDPGRFKDVFALLHSVNIGDRVYVYHDQERFDYEVYETKVVLPTQVDILTQAGDDRLTLITCTPVGTNLKRLVVLARPV